MNEANHTPGPWFVGGYIHDEEDPESYPEWVVQHATPAGDLSVAVCVHVADPEVHKANAMLVSAAPDFLKAAHATMAWWEDNQYETTGENGEWNLFDSEPEFVTAARAAILKATGGEQ